MRRSFISNYLSVANVRKKSNCTSALNSNSYLTLMLCAGSLNSAGQDLGTLAEAMLKSCNILIVDMLDLICTEHTYLSALVAVYRVLTSNLCGSCCLCLCVFFNNIHYFVIHCILRISPWGNILLS